MVKTLFAYHPQNLDHQVLRFFEKSQQIGHQISDLDYRQLFDHGVNSTLFIAEIAYTPIQELSD